MVVNKVLPAVLGLVLVGESGVKASSLEHESLVLGHFAVYRWSMEVARSGIRWKLRMRDVSEMVGASPGALVGRSYFGWNRG